MRTFTITFTGMVVAFAAAAWGLDIDLVTVGNPGNQPLESLEYGAVDYTFDMGKFEITAAEYTAFLNAVAATDTYGLYSLKMVDPGGCNIQRSGAPGSYTYSVAADWANRPVNRVSWGDAARFSNWLTNGQPIGSQDLSTTEDGSYFLNGMTAGIALNDVQRRPDAKYVIPNVDEWFKSAYYDPDKPGGAGYWLFATRSDTLPSNVLSATGTNNANIWGDTPTLGAPYWRTEVGAFAGSPSAYGTFDQTGNVFEWLEDASSRFNVGEQRWEYYHGMTGGSYAPSLVGVSHPYQVDTLAKDSLIGFRVALVPEPATLSLLAAAGGLALLLRRKPRG